MIGRPIADADAAPGAAPVVVIGHDVWQRRFAGARDVIGRELRLGKNVHTVIGVMPDGFQFPLNFRYWVPLRRVADGMLRNTGPEGAVFGRLAPGATLARAHAEVSALGILPALRSAQREGGPTAETTGARVVPYTFAFTGDFESGELGLLWSLSSLLLVLLLLPPCANIAILNYARTVTRQQEFAARHALGGSRARIVWQLFIESLVLTAAAAGVALLLLRVVSVVVAGRLQNIPGGPPFWMTFGVSYRTLLFVAVLALAGAAVSGLVPALQATGRLARLGAGALAGRTSVRLGATWTTLVIAQVAFSVAVLPLAAELAWGTLRTGIVGPGFAAEEFATARVALEGGQSVLFGNRQRELTRRLLADPGILGVAAALRPPGEEPWVFVDIEGRDAPTEVAQRPAAGIPRPVQPGRYRVLRSLSGAWPRRPPIRRGRRRRGGRCGHRQPQLRRDHRSRRQRARTPFPLRPRDGQRVAARPGSGPLVRSRRCRRKPAGDDRRTGRVPCGGPGSNPSCAPATSPQRRSGRSR